jgi:hypothetical protein
MALRSRPRELPCFSAQENTRLCRDLSAKQNTALGKLGGAAGFLDRNVTFIFHFDENVTVALCKTKALILIADSTSGEARRSPRDAPMIFSARNRRINLLLKRAHAVHLRALAAPTIFDQRGSRHGADVQIGGGVRVGDAFQGDCRTETCSNTGNGELRPNLSSEAHHASAVQEERRDKGTASVTKATEPERAGCTG